ncbi:hypothetical protein [Actinocorallia populi]|uniref:hypothetical protein n=1 Tax=Actinocorallia populi TaxID=2079200 RepID=UPI0018E57F5A|nr:hypothetical protein [Actinocorallia populi]
MDRRGGPPPKSAKDDHEQRHTVECGIDHPKRHRAVAARYEATVLIAAIDEWL